MRGNFTDELNGVIVEDINSTVDPRLNTDNVSFWATTLNGSDPGDLVTTAEFLITTATYSPNPVEATCERYWYDLNETNVSHVSQVSRGAYASISFIFLAVFVSSTFLNCMLLAVIGKYDGLKNPLRMLLLNLAACDLVATVLGVFMTTLSNAMGYFHLGMTACKIEGFVTFFCGSTRLLRLPYILFIIKILLCTKISVNAYTPM